MSTNSSGSSPGLVSLPAPHPGCWPYDCSGEPASMAPVPWPDCWWSPGTQTGLGSHWFTLAGLCSLQPGDFLQLSMCTNCSQGEIPVRKKLGACASSVCLLTYGQKICMFYYIKIYIYIYFIKHIWYVTFKGLSYNCDVLLIIFISFT